MGTYVCVKKYYNTIDAVSTAAVHNNLTRLVRDKTFFKRLRSKNPSTGEKLLIGRGHAMKSDGRRGVCDDDKRTMTWTEKHAQRARQCVRRAHESIILSDEYLYVTALVVDNEWCKRL